MKRVSKISGFTLIEMMIVVIIMFVVAGGVIPKVKGSYAMNHLRNDRLTIGTILRAASAKSRAIRQNVVAEIDEGTNNIMTYIDNNADSAFNTGDVKLSSFTTAADVDLITANGQLKWSFLARGTMRLSSTGTFWISVLGATKVSAQKNQWYKFTATSGGMRVAIYDGY